METKRYKDRVELHCHSSYSKHDGVNTPREIILFAEANNIPAIAITDHGDIAAFPEMEHLNKKSTSRFIYGMEAYVENDCIDFYKKGVIDKLTILVKNDIGKKNLYKIVSKSQEYIRAGRSIIPLSFLLGNRDGLLIGTGGDPGFLFKLVFHEATDEDLMEVAKLFDYIEVQPCSTKNYMIGREYYGNLSLRDLEDITKKVISIGESCHIPVVATSDTHYISDEDKLARTIMLHMNNYDEPFDEDNLHLRSTEEMLAEFAFLSKEKAYEIVVENTNKIAEECESISVLTNEELYPKYEGAYEELKSLCFSLIEDKYQGELESLAKVMLDKELDVIKKQDSAFIFLDVRDIMLSYNLRNCDISERGIWSGSIVAYIIGITEMDPIKYNLQPETIYGYDGSRFIDVDINVPKDIREDVAKSVSKLRGVGQVIRAGISRCFSDKKIDEGIDSFNNTYSVDLTPEQKEVCKIKLQNMCTHRGMNQYGLIIAPNREAIESVTPISKEFQYEDGQVVEATIFDYYCIDSLYKLDVLGHDMLMQLRLLEKRTGVKLDSIIIDDDMVANLFCTEKNDYGASYFTYISGLDSPIILEMLDLLKPNTMNDLAKILCLAHGTLVWEDNIKNLVLENNLTLEEIFASRDDVFDYCINLGLDRKTSYDIMDNVRKGTFVRGNEPRWNDWKKLFIAHGAEDWVIGCFEKIKYMFPRSHSLSYLFMYLRMAWFYLNYNDDYWFVVDKWEGRESEKIYRIYDDV